MYREVREKAGARHTGGIFFKSDGAMHQAQHGALYLPQPADTGRYRVRETDTIRGATAQDSGLFEKRPGEKL